MLNKCHLDQKTADKLGENFYRVNNDSNGNPRYVIHWLAFGANDYNEALSLAKSIGYKAYRASEFGGGFVTSSYNLENEAEAIIDARGV
jgi:hypothetical protein